MDNADHAAGAANERPIASRKALLALVAINALVYLFYARTVSGGLDYQAFYFAGKAAARAPNRIYDLGYQLSQEKQLGTRAFAPFFHPPHEILVFLPFSSLPYTASLNAWRIFNLLCLILSGLLLARVIGMDAITATLLTVAMSSVGMALFLGQDSPLLLLLLCGCFYLLKENRDVAAALVLTMALFKPQLPVVIALAILAVGRKRFFAWFAGFGTILTATSIAFVGRAGLQQILQAEKLGEQGLGVAAMPTVRGVVAFVIGDHLWLAVALLAGVVLAMFPVWRRSNSLEVAVGSAVCLGSAFAPYFYAYELLVLALPMALIARKPQKPQVAMVAFLTSAVLLQILYFLKASSLLVIPTILLGVMTSRRPGLVGISGG